MRMLLSAKRTPSEKEEVEKKMVNDCNRKSNLSFIF